MDPVWWAELASMDGCKLEEHSLGGRLKLQFILLGLLHEVLLNCCGRDLLLWAER